MKNNLETLEFRTSYSGGYYVTTHAELAGRGIKKSGDGSFHKRGMKTYHVTKSAWNKLETKFKTIFIF